MISGPEARRYSLRGIQEMLGLSRGVVMGLVDAGFVTPERGPRNAWRFAFRDVVLLRTAVELQAAKIPPRRIVASLRKLRAGLPDALPLSGLRITAVGGEVAVRERGGAAWHAESGQGVLDFEVQPRRGTVAFLDRAGGRSRGPTGAANAPPPRGAVDRDAPPRANREAPFRGAGAEAAFERGETLEPTDRRAAEAAYRRALALDPDLADAYLNLGALLCETGRCRDAIALYDLAIRRRPEVALLHYNRAIALEDAGRAADALGAYDAALTLDRSLADAHWNAARLHEQRGEPRLAVRHLSAYRRLQRG